MSTSALHGLSMDKTGAHCKNVLQLGLPLHLDAAYFDHVHGQSLPYTRFSYFPFHGLLGVWLLLRAYVHPQKKRHWVRCVNEGHVQLRKHLLQELEDKRLSKVGTLRAAIYYVKHLWSLLDLNVSGMKMSLRDVRNCAAAAEDRVQQWWRILAQVGTAI